MVRRRLRTKLSRLATISWVGPRQVATPRPDQLEPWADQIYRWITNDRLQMTRIHELLSMRGCELDFTQNLKEATDAITLGLRHLRLASEGFSLSAANADVQELPATLCH